jgi:hypothetical protein
MLLLGLMTPATWAAPTTPPASEQTAPYVEGRDFEVSPQEYQDLLSYLNQAEQILKTTILDSSRLGGNQLHDRLIEGMHGALSESGPRAELLLFRYILNRALDLDQIFMQASGAGATIVVSSSAVLLASVRIALNYCQTQDIKRDASMKIPMPDWVGLARDQIPVLLRIADMAPTVDAKFEIVKRALGWTARSLNSAPNRRDYAEMIVNLSQTLSALGQTGHSVAEAENLLLQIKGKLAGNSQAAAVAFPAGSYPASNAQAPGPIFPLVNTDMSAPWQWSKVNGDPWGFAATSLQIGPGVGVENSSGAGRSTDGFAGVNARADLLVAGLTNWQQGPPLGAGVDFRANAGTTFSGVPVYDVKFNGYASAFYLGGAWLALETDQYPKVADQLVRLGGGIAAPIPISIDNVEYLLIRAQIGAVWMAGNVGGTQVSNPQDPGLAYELAAILKLTKFIIHVSFGQDYGLQTNDGATKVHRTELEAALTIPLGAIFKNDVVMIEGKHIFYNFDGGSPTVTQTTVGAFYAIKW